MPTTTDVRTLTTDLTTRSSDDNGMTVEGYAMLYDQPSVPMPFVEYIDRGALDNVDLSKVLLLYGHDLNSVLARSDAENLQLRADDKGLWFRATLPDTTLGRDTYTNVANGNLKGCSVGFKIGDDKWLQGNDGQVIHHIRSFDQLIEISITPIPAYTETSVDVQRSLEAFMKGENEVEIDYDKLADAVADKLEQRSAEQADVETTDETDKQDVEKPEEPQKEEKPEEQPADDSDSAEKDAKPAEKPAEKVEKRSEPHASIVTTDEKMKEGTEMRELHGANESAKDQFAHFLKTGEITRDNTTGGIGLSKGQVLIPQDILPAEHEQHQFPRLGNLVRQIAVKHTTGKLPVFQPGSGKLALHTELQSTANSTSPEIKEILWNLKTYTGRYVFTRELIDDSDYNWEAELRSRLTELRDNTEDDLIVTQLTNGVTAVKPTNLIDDLKLILDSKLKPYDSNAASIVLSQSAFAQLDQMKDSEGRPLVQPNVTLGTGNAILGKTVTVVDDTLFPSAKQGDVNIVVTPLQKAIIKFKSNEITGQFVDTDDIWYKALGIYLREDVVQANKDVINWVSSKASSTTTPGGEVHGSGQ
ncbi:phage major capsid protein [uncultured Limosilactobacillus sp.]|uniref:phage major capsid protein n=1 Tax=uncultured Limosilactobacillus sp. TaxID=2837629 RepID=UPI00259A5E3C|nr:phage major capsid protein [uncultured Limosilactobacillus sp.]